MPHFFPPIAGDDPRVLILGTFPSPLSRERGEYYGNPRNQFWRILFEIFDRPFHDPAYEEKRALLIQNRIALWDVIQSCEVEGALDSAIRNPVYNLALPRFIAEKGIGAVFFNGGNACRFYKRGIGATDGQVLPSTSPANARMRIADKAERWRIVAANHD